MPLTNGRRDSDIQAAEGATDPDLESLIAPQGYAPEFVDDVTTMETPAEQRRKAIRFAIISLVILAAGFWLCTPANLVIPDLSSPAPYGVDRRPTPPTNKFLEDILPPTVGEFRLVDVKKDQLFEDPFVGATAVQGTYLDSIGQPVSVTMIQAESYINARRYLENYEKLLEEQARPVELNSRLYIDKNYLQWAAPSFADRAYGLAWNNDRYFISVTSPISAAQQALAASFPY